MTATETETATEAAADAAQAAADAADAAAEAAAAEPEPEAAPATVEVHVEPEAAPDTGAADGPSVDRQLDTEQRLTRVEDAVIALGEVVPALGQAISERPTREEVARQDAAVAAEAAATADALDEVHDDDPGVTADGLRVDEAPGAGGTEIETITPDVPPVHEKKKRGFRW